MAPARVLERNVKVPKAVQDDELSKDDYDGPEDGSEEDEGSDGEVESEVEGEQVSDDEEDVAGKISSVSFGALKKAQDTLARKRKRDANEAPEQGDKLDVLRKRLKQIKEQQGVVNTKPTISSRQTTSDNDDDASDSDSDSAPSEEGAPMSRTSKHAPQQQTSRHQVSRKRTVIDVPKRIIRDPRFDNIPSQTQYNPAAATTGDKAYGFLRDYQRNEITELKSALRRKGITEDEVYNLRRKINSMENRLKAHEAKEREQKVRSEHRKEERVRVKEGKTPYYLKEKDVKERALVEKYNGMKGKEREKLVQKRALKEDQKEKRRMPRERRVV